MAYEKEKKTAVALEYTPGEQAPKVIASGSKKRRAGGRIFEILRL